MFLALLVVLAIAAMTLHAEDAFVTAYTGGSQTANPPFAYGTGISGYGTSAVGTASPAPPSRTRAMYGYQLGTNAWVTTQPTLASMGPGVGYQIFILRGTDGNASPDVIVNISADGGDLLDTSGNPQTTIATTAFQPGSGALNNWLLVGTITNLTTTTPTILWAYASGTQASTGGRCYFDAFRFFYAGPCAAVTQVSITNAVFQNQTTVNVAGVVDGATDVTVFADGFQIGTTNYAAGFAAGTVKVPTTPLMINSVLTAQQTRGACTSQLPPAGPVVGGGANPKVSVSLGCWKNSAWTGPIGTNAPSGFTDSYFVKATALTGGYATAPVGGQELLPSPCWQEVTFNQQSDPCINQSTAAVLVNSDNYCALESIVIAIDEADSGPYDIYIDKIMNGTNIIENFEGYAPGAGVTLNNPSAASVPNPSAYYYLGATNSSLVSSAHAFDGTNACRVQWQFLDGSDIRWAHVLANRSTGKTYPELDVKQPVTVRFLVLPVGVTTDHKFNGTVSAITNSTPLYQGGTAVLGVTVTGTGSYTYEWFYQGNSLGIYTQTYTIPFLPFNPTDLAPWTDGPYSVVVNDGSCSASPSPVILNTAYPAPIITSQPVSQVVNVGSPAPICVTATPSPAPGDSISGYQWEFFGNSPTNTPVAIAATSSCLGTGSGITSAQLTDSGYYDVIVMGGTYGLNTTSSIVSLQVVAPGVVIANGTGLRGDYYNNATYTNAQPPAGVAFPGSPVVSRIDPTVNNVWGNGSPDPAIHADYFTARWYGQVQPLTADTYTFTARTDDGVRVWVDNQLVVDYWTATGPRDSLGTIALDTSKHDILMEYFEKTGGATAQLSWSNASGTISESFVPVQQLFPKAAYITPLIALTSPADGSSVTLPAPVNLAANVTTNDGMIAYVSFYTNATLLASVTNPPYAFSWSGALPGTYAISAQVLYNASANGANPSSLARSGTNMVTLIANAASSVTISNLVGTTLSYGGGGGAQFVLLESTNVSTALLNWTPVATNTATPGSFTISTGAGTQKFYRIQSE